MTGTGTTAADILEQTRRILAETPDSTASAGTGACCSTAKQEVCCEPSEKTDCCGATGTAAGGCGCQ